MNNFTNWLREHYTKHRMFSGYSRSEGEGEFNRAYNKITSVINYESLFWIVLTLLFITFFF